MEVQIADIEALEKEIFEKKKLLAEMRRSHRELVKDYELDSPNGKRPLSSFFGGKEELVVVHNMGRSCNYCSLWADGFTGLTRHITSRAGFVLVSADPINEVVETAGRRGWNFPVASNGNSGFAVDMKMMEDSGPMPGISAFTKEDGQIYRRGFTYLGEGDDFCAIWHIWDLFPSGHGSWSPK